MTKEVRKHKVWKTRYIAIRLIVNDLIRCKRLFAVFSGMEPDRKDLPNE
jgi:hypothetical protein